MTTKNIKTYPNGEQYIEFTDEEMRVVGWNPGDTLRWTPNEDGVSYTLTRVEEETELVLVECIHSYRMRYCVEVPKGKTEWALDTVTMQEAKEFSQLALDEQIISHRTIKMDEALELCVKDNDYCSSWSDEQLVNAFFTTADDSE